VTYVYDPRDYSAPGIIYVPTSDEYRDDEPIPGDDDWEGPEEEPVRCERCGRIYLTSDCWFCSS
jgi:hypothetical protein